MAIDTTQVGEFEYPAKRTSAPRHRPPPTGAAREWLRPNILWAMVGAVVGYLIGHWLGNVIASGYEQVQEHAARTTSPSCSGSSLGVAGWMAGIGGFNYPLAKVLGYELAPASSRDELGPLLPHDRGPQGGRAAVHGRGPPVPLHRRPAGHADPHRAAQPDRATSSAPGPTSPSSSEHGTIMMMMASSAVVGPLGNWLVPLMIGVTAHGLPTRRGLLVLDLHGGLPGHPERAVLRRVPDRVDRLRPAADAGGGRDGLLSGRLRRDRDRHDPGRLQPGRHHHQLPGARHDLGPGADLRLGHPGHHRPAHPGHADPRRGRPLRHPRPHRPDRVLRQRARRQQLPVAEPLLVLRPSRGVHHGPARLRDRDGDHAGLHPEAALRLQGRGGRHARRGAPVLLRLAAPPLPERHQPGHAAAVHAHDGAHLHPDRIPLPGHAGHALEGEDHGSTPRCSSASGCCSTS